MENIEEFNDSKEYLYIGQAAKFFSLSKQQFECLLFEAGDRISTTKDSQGKRMFLKEDLVNLKDYYQQQSKAQVDIQNLETRISDLAIHLQKLDEHFCIVSERYDTLFAKKRKDARWDDVKQIVFLYLGIAISFVAEALVFWLKPAGLFTLAALIIILILIYLFRQYNK